MTDQGVTPDLAARQEAIDPKGCFYVNAPAGSGKTELLSQRLLALLAMVEEPEEILAMTFTRKAATELRHRVIDALIEASHSAERPVSLHRQQTLDLARRVLDRDQTRDWQLLDQPQRLRVMTLDSFNDWLARQAPQAALFSPEMRIAEDPDALYEEAARMLIDESARTSERELSGLFVALDNRLDRIEELLCRLLARRDQWMPFLSVFVSDSLSRTREMLENSRRALIERALSPLTAFFTPISEPLWRLLQTVFANGFSGPALNEDSLKVDRASVLERFFATGNAALITRASAEMLPLFQLCASLFLTKNGTFRVRSSKQIGLPPEQKQAKENWISLRDHLAAINGLDDQLAGALELPAIRYEDEHWQSLIALCGLLPKLAACFRVVCQRHCSSDYIEMAQMAQMALGETLEPGMAALKLDHRLHHILIDEFQDTSPSQLALLEKLTEGWAEHNQADPDNPRTLFVVGDGQQSCYLFRDADVRLFIDVGRNGVGDLSLKRLSLSANFRSSPQLVNFVNDCFGKAFVNHDDDFYGAIRHSPAQSMRAPLLTSELLGDAVQWHAFLASDTASGRAEEARWIVARIVELRRRFPEDTIALLVRARTHLAALLPELLRAQAADPEFSWRAEELHRLFGRTTIIDLLSLLRALLNPADRVAWLSVLRAPWCGLTNSDLQRLAGGGEGRRSVIWERLGDARVLSQLSEDGASRARHLYSVFAAARAQQARRPLRVWLCDVWLALGGADAVSPEEAMEPEVFFDLLNEFDSGSELVDFVGFSRRLEQMTTPSQGVADSKVQIMTMHKAKGLEFDHVLLPSLSATTSSNQSELLIWDVVPRLGPERGGDFLMSSLSLSNDRGGDDLYQALRGIASRRQHYENTRLLYVAATRASKSLCCSAVFKAKEEDLAMSSAGIASGKSLQKPNKNSLLAGVFDGLGQDQWSLHDCQEQPQAAAQPDTLRRICLRRIEQLRRDARERSTSTEKPAPPDLQRALVDERAFSRRCGEMIHRALQCLAGPWQGKLPQGVKALWRAELCEFGVIEERMDEALERIADHVAKTLADRDGAWILSIDRAQAVAELDLTRLESGVQKRLIIDRSFIDERGRRWFIDYKSDMPKSGQSVQDWLSRASAPYEKQIARYAEALRDLDNGARPLVAALYFTGLPKLVKIDLSER